jgi:hypothetical protein
LPLVVCVVQPAGTVAARALHRNLVGWCRANVRARTFAGFAGIDPKALQSPKGFGQNIPAIPAEPAKLYLRKGKIRLGTASLRVGGIPRVNVRTPEPANHIPVHLALPRAFQWSHPSCPSWSLGGECKRRSSWDFKGVARVQSLENGNFPSYCRQLCRARKEERPSHQPFTISPTAERFLWRARHRARHWPAS